ncbi:MAG: hypothetical protein M1282_10755 [Chloroflexi bacterium]|nr:hypothetical protein [Chloroflexota bacterium]
MAKFGWFIIIALLIGGCASAPATQSPESLRVLQCTEGWSCVSGPEDTPLPSSTDGGRAQTGSSSQPGASPAPAAGQVLVHAIQGKVAVQETPGGNYVPAQTGVIIPVGASIQTDGSGRARLTIQPRGTAINIGRNSSLAVKSLSSNGSSKLEIHVTLDAGKIWILPRGDQVAVKTEIGTASADGSPFGADYDPNAKNLAASCLEGICSLKNDEGEVILTSGMMATISNGHLPYSAEQMSGDILQEWANENPDLKDYFGSNFPGWIPDPNSPGG